MAAFYLRLSQSQSDRDPGYCSSSRIKQNFNNLEGIIFVLKCDCEDEGSIRCENTYFRTMWEYIVPVEILPLLTLLC